MRQLTPEQMTSYVESLAASYKDLAKKEVAVGITSDNATTAIYGSGKTVLEIGSIHEFGAGNLPRRSFIKNSNELKSSEIKEKIEQVLLNISEGSDVDGELSFLGIFVQNIYKDAFISKGFGTWPDISQLTKDNKRSSQVLIDTGTLRRSINHEVRNK